MPTINEDYNQLTQVQVSNVAGVVYTVPASTQAIIKNMAVVNPSGGDCWVKIWINGTSDTNIYLPQVTLGSNEWGNNDDTITLNAGDTIQAQAETAATITMTIHGVELETV